MKGVMFGTLFKTTDQLRDMNIDRLFWIFFYLLYLFNYFFSLPCFIVRDLEKILFKVQIGDK